MSALPHWIDAHCHLADPRMDSLRAEVIGRARAAGVSRFIQGGVSPEDWERQLVLQAQYPGAVFCSFGLHPWWIAEQTAEDCERALEALPRYLDRAVGFGELGLDFGPRTPTETRSLQLSCFKRQLELARTADKPLILHVVKAHFEAIALMKQIGLPRQGGLVHAFSAGSEIAREYLELGLTLSVGGILARKGFETLKRAMVSVPLDQVVVESDSPDQSPPCFAGRLNEPISIIEVAKALGALRGIDKDEILEKSRSNLVRIFGLD